MEVITGDGTRQVSVVEAFDAVVVAAAAPQVPIALVRQLREGGRLVQPISDPSTEKVTLFERHRGQLVPIRVLCPALFVPLVSSDMPGPSAP